MRWTCPDCRARHETAIDPDGEAGRIVEVNCRACGTQHEASVFVRFQRPGKARMIVGVVWL
jgi:transcription elongation factor Elf1